MLVIEEEEPPPKPAASLMDLIGIRGITWSGHMTAAAAAVPVTVVTGVTVNMLAPGDLRAEITVTRCLSFFIM
jgi:hypothetical protein